MTLNFSGISFNQSFDVSSQGTIPTGLSFNNDGTKLYVSLEETGTIQSYNLSNAFDVSSASPANSLDATQFLSGDSDRIDDVTFSDSGDRIFIVESRTDDFLLQYNLSTNFDISTASYESNFDFSDQDGMIAVAFSDGGNKMYFVDDGIYEYDLSTAFDSSTASFKQSAITGGPTFGGVFFFENGGSVLVTEYINTDELRQFSLSSENDVSTASFDSSVSISSETDEPHGVYFDSSARKLYVTDEENDRILEYDTDSPGSILQVNGNGLKVTTDSAVIKTEPNL